MMYKSNQHLYLSFASLSFLLLCRTWIAYLELQMSSWTLRTRAILQGWVSRELKGIVFLWISWHRAIWPAVDCPPPILRERHIYTPNLFQVFLFWVSFSQPNCNPKYSIKSITRFLCYLIYHWSLLGDNLSNPQTSFPLLFAFKLLENIPQCLHFAIPLCYFI